MELVIDFSLSREIALRNIEIRIERFRPIALSPRAAEWPVAIQMRRIEMLRSLEQQRDRISAFSEETWKEVASNEAKLDELWDGKISHEEFFSSLM